MTTRAGWKAYERRVAAALGGMRVPVTGIDRHGADVVTPLFDVQVKLRASLPQWLFAWLGGICNNAKRAEKIGLLVLKTPRMRDGDAIVVCRMRDFVDLHGASLPTSSIATVNAHGEHEPVLPGLFDGVAADAIEEMPHELTVAWLRKAGATNVTIDAVATWSSDERDAARTWAFEQLDARDRDKPGHTTSVRWPEHVSRAHHGATAPTIARRRTRIGSGKRSAPDSTSASSSAGVVPRPAEMVELP